MEQKQAKLMLSKDLWVKQMLKKNNPWTKWNIWAPLCAQQYAQSSHICLILMKTL